MMNQYSRKTIVQPLARIRRQRLLPKGGEVIVKLGQDVNPLQVLARAPLNMQYHVLTPARALNVSVEKLDEMLLVQEGEKIETGQPLAQKKRLIGQQLFESPIDGEIAKIYGGRILVKQATDYVELRAMAKGRVVSYIDDRGVLLDIVGTQIQAMWSTGDVALGPLKVVGDKPTRSLNNADISDDIDNHIVAVGHLDSLEAMQTAMLQGASGFIVGTMSAELAAASGELNTTILLTDGFGEHGMATPIFSQLQRLVGKDTTLFARDGINANQRAEVIIPQSGRPSLEEPAYNKPLEVGQTVRILRQPYLGQTGSIEYLHNKFYKTPSGVRVRGAKVRLQNGQTVFVPTANLDAII